VNPTASRPPDNLAAMITGSTQLCAVIGDPVHHSLSPILHNAAFAHTNQDAVYLALHVSAGAGRHAIEAMRTFNLLGLSVTMPHKFAVADAVDRLTPQAASLGSCNTVFRDLEDPNILWGDSTDGDGFVSGLLERHGSHIELSGASAVVIGAGGAGRAVVEALGRAGLADIAVLNRDSAKAASAAALAAVGRVGVTGDLAAAQLIVNATSLGMTEGDPLPCDVTQLQSGQLVADLIYHPAQTRFLAEAAAQGALTMNGLPMLLHQAALQFHRWTGLPAPVEVMSAALHAELFARHGSVSA
jgi:shikimate dehydrogenase